jgi:hypothetical protein
MYFLHRWALEGPMWQKIEMCNLEILPPFNETYHEIIKIGIITCQQSFIQKYSKIKS